MLVCIPFSWLWMLPDQLKDFSESLIATSFFSSNILFWQESGYFDLSSEEKPLLHTWSLAVEEQYYIIFPILLGLIWKLGRKSVLSITVIVAVTSLVLSELASIRSPVANFYLSPTRAWELLTGSIIAFVLIKRNVGNSQLLSLLGLLSIILAIFLFDEKTPFPSLLTLIPVLGTVLVILFFK